MGDQEEGTQVPAGQAPPPLPAGTGAAGAAGAGTSAAPAAGVPAPARRPLTSDLPEEVLDLRLKTERRRGQDDATAKLLKEFGVASIEELKARQQRAAELEADTEKRKKSEMSELDRLKAELAAANDRAAKLEAEKQQLADDVQAQQAEQVFARAAARHVDPSMVDAARLLWATEVRRRVKEDPTEELGEREADRFFKRLVEKNPRFAVQVADGAAPPPKPPAPTVRKVTVGAPPTRAAGQPPPRPAPPAPGTGANGKRMGPGFPNSMTPQEAREAAAAQGYKI